MTNQSITTPCGLLKQDSPMNPLAKSSVRRNLPFTSARVVVRHYSFPHSDIGRLRRGCDRLVRDGFPQSPPGGLQEPPLSHRRRIRGHDHPDELRDQNRIAPVLPAAHVDVRSGVERPGQLSKPNAQRPLGPACRSVDQVGGTRFKQLARCDPSHERRANPPIRDLPSGTREPPVG